MGRRFWEKDAVVTLYEWVESLEAVEVLEFELVQSFPRKVYPRESGEKGAGQTLVEAGLSPQAALFVQPLV